MKRAIALLIAWATFAPAQGPAQSSPTDFTELKAYLQLSDDQVHALRQIQRQQDDDLQAAYQQMYDKIALVRQLLGSGSSDATQIGQLEIDVVQLRSQLTVAASPYRRQSFAILTADQQRRLPALVDALVLIDLASQAVTLRLIDNPTLPGAVMRQSPVTPK